MEAQHPASSMSSSLLLYLVSEDWATFTAGTVAPRQLAFPKAAGLELCLFASALASTAHSPHNGRLMC